MNLGLEGKTVVVTGGSRGIGAAVVGMMETEGAKVIPLSRTSRIVCDLTSEASTDAAFAQIPHIDILVNAVGGKSAAPMMLNYVTVIRAIRAALLKMDEHGSIVNVASISGLEPGADPDYSAAKAAVISLTKSMSRDIAPVRINCVAPGSVDGPQREEWRVSTPERYQRIIDDIPLGRLGTADEVARVVAFLASPACAWVTGSCWVVDGGRTWSI